MRSLNAPAGALRLLQEYLDRSIPLVPQMQVRAAELNESRLVLAAPLSPNRNHIGTVFGGSLNGLATLACWGLVWLALHERGAHIVIQESHMKFRKPATDDFSAACHLPDVVLLDSFIAQFERRGRARIALTADVSCKDTLVATFAGTFAAIRADEQETA